MDTLFPELESVLADKCAPIAQLVHRGVNEDVLFAELEKCDVLCANCHLILHHGKAD